MIVPLNIKVDLNSSKVFKSIIGDKGKDLGTLVKDFTVRLRHVYYLYSYPGKNLMTENMIRPWFIIFNKNKATAILRSLE